MTTGDLAREPMDRLVTALVWVVVVAAGLAVLGLALPGDLGDTVAAAAVVVVIAAPLLRVFWLIAAWWRSGDWRFVGIGCALLTVVALGTLVAVLS
jgi:hypothetical protein